MPGDQGEHGCPEPCLDFNKRVVGESESAGELEEAEEYCAEQSLSARNLPPRDHHDKDDQRCSERKTQGGPPKRGQLAIAEADGDAVGPCEERLSDKGPQDDACTPRRSRGSLRFPHALPNGCTGSPVSGLRVKGRSQDDGDPPGLRGRRPSPAGARAIRCAGASARARTAPIATECPPAGYPSNSSRRRTSCG